MRAIQIAEVGGPEVLRLTELPDPRPGPGQLLVRVAAAGVNFIDTYHRSGAYPTRLPLVSGREGAGTVLAVGPDGTAGGTADVQRFADGQHFAVGDRVAWGTCIGSYAEQILVPAEQAVPVPEDLDLDTAAASMLQGMTAHYLTASTWPIRPHQVALVHAAAGGVGLLLTQLVTARGGQVIGTVSTAEKERLAREAGAAEVIRYGEVADLAAAVRGITGDRGVDVVYDGVGAATFDASLAALRPRGMLVLFGAASGPVPPVDPQRLNTAGSVFLTRPNLAHYTATPDELVWRASEVFDAIRHGSLRIRITQRYPLAEARRAHEDLESRRTTGKLLLLPTE